MNSKDYFVGLDMGTNSIGWAATNLDYSLCRFKQQDMWGVRLFDEAKTAEERRIFRTARRRNERKKERIRLTQALFAEEIAKKDAEFFLRLNESKYILIDKKVCTPNIFFNDVDYSDADYFNEYPTIQHLKKAFLEKKKITDPRKLYLVVSHYMKNRGHFLFSTLNAEAAEETMDFEPIFFALNDYLREEYELVLPCSDLQEFQAILKNPGLGKSKKGAALIALTGVKDMQFKSILQMMSGSKKQLKDILHSDEYDKDLVKELENAEIASISFTENLEDKWDIIEQELGDRFELLKRIQAVYDWSVLAEILRGEKYLSFAKVKSYEEHQADLKNLKYIIKTYLPKKYDEFFNSNTVPDNYTAYVGSTLVGGKKLSIIEKCDQNAFCKTVRTLLKGLAVKVSDQAVFDDLCEKAENDRLLPKQVSKDNSTIPYQVNAAELSQILTNAAVYFPFLLEKDINGLSNKDKIEKIFSFRIPYYVGPLNSRKNTNDVGWIVRDWNEKITPWNFEQVVDKKKSAEKFIRRMTNKCTYLFKEDVLPKNSLLYSRFIVLNELNNLKINGKMITVEQKQRIYNDLFMVKNKVTNKTLRDYLVSVADFNVKKDVISGIDDDFKSNLKSYRDFAIILGENFIKQNSVVKMVEELILWILLFGEDRRMLESAIKEKYQSYLNESQIQQICKLTYSGWGRISKRLLDELEGVDSVTGEVGTMMDFLWQSNENFMEILHGRGFLAAIDRENAGDGKKSVEDLIEEMHLAPAVKRPVLQAVRIVAEVEKIQKYPPKKIFIEMARGKQNTGRTKSRKSRLLELYQSCKKEEPNLFSLLENETEANLRRDRLYLYYVQFGKCMYSGEELEISQLYNPAICDVDHIYPRSKIKDDSLDNRVLVLRKENQNKKDNYPLSSGIRRKMFPFWKELKKKHLISEEKFERLVRDDQNKLTEKELGDFVARQLVETRQSTKAVAHIFKIFYPETEIVYVKSHLVSDFRNGENITRDSGEEPICFLKCREVNDHHHAKDAYLNIVVGNVYNVKITHNRVNFIADLRDGKVSMNRMFDYDIGNAWQSGRDGSMKTVCKTMQKNSVLFTRLATEVKGGFYDQKIVKKGKGQAPVKSSDKRLQNIAVYGGYNKLSIAYFCVIEHEDKKGCYVRKIEGIPVLYKEEFEKNPQNYCIARLQLKNPIIVVPRIKINSLLEIDGFKMHLSGKSNQNIILRPAIQLILSEEEMQYIRYIAKYLDRCKNGDRLRLAVDEYEVGSYDFVSKEKNIQLYSVLCNKMCDTIFSKKFKKLGNELIELEVKKCFAALTIYQQVFTLLEILNILHCTASLGDLHYLSKNGKSGTRKGTLSQSMNYSSSVKSFNLINQSVTGLFESKVDLLAGMKK